MLSAELDASTIRNTLMPLRAIFRHLSAIDEVAVNPTSGLQVPAVRSRGYRIASPDEASDLIAAVPRQDRALWATAMYAGLRRGELQALDWSDADLAEGLISVGGRGTSRKASSRPRAGQGGGPCRSPGSSAITWSSTG
jgi:integrase